MLDAFKRNNIRQSPERSIVDQAEIDGFERFEMVRDLIFVGQLTSAQNANSAKRGRDYA